MAPSSLAAVFGVGPRTGPLIGAKKLDSVKKVVRLLKAQGTIATGRQVITILQPAVLRDIADGKPVS